MESAWNYAATGGRVDQGIVIAESLIDFDYEITLLTVRSKDSKGHTCTKFCDPIGHIQENGDYIESFQPQPMSKKALEKSKKIAKLIKIEARVINVNILRLIINGSYINKKKDQFSLNLLFSIL